jgi:hypothetical protein
MYRSGLSYEDKRENEVVDKTNVDVISNMFH